MTASQKFTAQRQARKRAAEIRKANEEQACLAHFSLKPCPICKLERAA